LYLFYNYNDNNNYNFIIFYYLKKSKYNVFTNLYKYFKINLLIFIFVQKYEISPLVFLVPIWSQFLKKWYNLVIFH